MDDFKNSTKTQYAMGGAAYAKGGSVKGAAKVAKVMGEFKAGTLHSGSKSGPKVTNPKQATAIAMSESGKVMKKSNGGAVARGNRMQAEEAGESRLARRVPPRKARPAMTAEERAMAETIARGNRMSAEEAGESRVMRRGAPMLNRKHGGLAVMPKGKKC